MLHPDSETSLTEWINKVRISDWENPADIKNTFSTADLLGNHSARVIFNIGRNKYRLIVKYYFDGNQLHLFICWVGTHAAYSQICKKNKQYKINIF